ncbi:MAG: hypothetical protein K2G36_06145 [Ruminococcus sp.]|nr:hypothetical protein [Ruminococcus sp.]
MEKDIIRISMLGGSGSGKTSFLSGIVQSMMVNNVVFGTGGTSSSILLNAVETRNTNSFFTDGEVVESAINNAVLLSQYLLSNEPDAPNGGFVNSTTDSIEFVFDLLIDGIQCCRIAIVDYAGELIDNPDNEAMQSNLKQLCSNIAQSDAIIIMADMSIIAGHSDNIFSLQRELGANMVNMIFPNIKAITESNNKPLTTLIAMTKSDHHEIPDMMKTSNFAGISNILYEKVYRKMFTCMNSNNDSWGIIPVSAVGNTNNTDEDNHIVENADIQAENIDNAILFCISNSLTRIISDKETELSEIRHQLRGFLMSRADRARLRKNSEILESQKNALEKCRNSIASLNDRFSATINNIHRANVTELNEVVKKKR